MNATVNIQEACLDSLEPCASIALLGKRRTGKTTWAKYILHCLNDQIDRFVALCGNKDNASEWKRMIQPLYVMNKDLLYLKRLRDYQDARVAEYSDNQLPIPRKYRICIILDDCGSDRAFMHSPIMKDILSNGRHYGMTVLILCQYLNQMHSENRDQIDYLGMLYTSNQKNIRKVHEEYVNICDLRAFNYVLNACTTEKGICWIDNTKSPSKIEECCYFKRSPWPMEFGKVGKECVRKYGNGHYLDKHNLSSTAVESVDILSNNDASHTKPDPGCTKVKMKYVDGLYKIDNDSCTSDDDSEVEILTTKNLLEDCPGHLLEKNCIFTDKKGSFVVKKETKEKIE